METKEKDEAKQIESRESDKDPLDNLAKDKCLEIEDISIVTKS